MDYVKPELYLIFYVYMAYHGKYGSSPNSSISTDPPRIGIPVGSKLVVSVYTIILFWTYTCPIGMALSGLTAVHYNLFRLTVKIQELQQGLPYLIAHKS